jgi:hypothetical protein
LIAEIWRLRKFISEIVAPDLRSAALTDCLSARVMPGSGNGISAEPPPEIRQRTKSSSQRSET